MSLDRSRLGKEMEGKTRTWYVCTYDYTFFEKGPPLLQIWHVHKETERELER